jgi:acyl carrier protein
LPAGTHELITYLVAQPGTAAPSPQELRRFLRDLLPVYMLPNQLIELERFPMQANGRIDRRRLPPPDPNAAAVAGAASHAPETPLQQQLAHIWAANLSLEQIGIHDNFFDLGGSSIPAVQTVVAIDQAFGISFPISRFFAEATIAEQADAIEELLIAQLAEMSDEDAERLLAELDDVA